MTHKLLLADDSVTIQRVVELTFSGEDVQVVTVGDGEQAIARIPVELPDIVLADIGMPKRSGYDVAAFVKGRPDLAHIPVLLLAGAFEPVDEARAQQVKSDGVLVKPFEPQQVISRVRDLIDKAAAAMRQPLSLVPPPSIEHPPEPELRTQSPEPRAESHAPKAESAAPPLDDYFDRLDAAFAELGSGPRLSPSPRSAEQDDFDEQPLPTVDHVLGSTSHSAEAVRPSHSRPARTDASEYEHAPGGVATATTSIAEAVPQGPGRNPVADMFAALFAVEQGESGAPPLQLPAPRAETPAVTDGLVDEVTRRVIERLAPDTANELVAQIVSEVAERLIREEIARIKSAVGTRL